MKLLPFLFGMLLASTSALAQVGGSGVSKSTPAGGIYYAKDFPGCTWSPTANAAACIQAAVNDAGAERGGTVMLPGGRFGLATTITIPGGVKISGTGANITPINVNSNVFADTCGTEIEALAGFTGPMFISSDAGNIGMHSMCLDAHGRASAAIKLESVQGSSFSNLRLLEGADATFHLDISAVGAFGSANNEFRNIVVRAGGGSVVIAGGATACRVGAYDMALPNKNIDVNNNTFDNLTCYSRDGWSLDLRGASSNRFFNTRFDSGNDGHMILRAGLDTASYMGWARYNMFVGTGVGGGGEGEIWVEGSNCNVAGWQGNNPATSTPWPATCPTNTMRRPSVDNFIFGFDKAGSKPNPKMGLASELFCNSTTQGGSCGNDTSPWTFFKSFPPVINKVADYAMLPRDCGASFNNRSATGPIILTLPPASDVGCRIEVNRWANQKVTIQPAGTDLIRGGSGFTAAGESIFADQGPGYSAIILEDQAANAWQVKGFTGIWLNTLTTSPSPVGRLPVSTVALLPACTVGREGHVLAITDANSATFNAPVVGGGANRVMAYCNSIAWVVH